MKPPPWICARCHKERPSCDRVADTTPDLCDHCWAVLHDPPLARLFRLLRLLPPLPAHCCEECADG